MDNCSFETILVNNSGIATRCKTCTNLHVAFGNFMLVFSKTGFPSFVNDIENTYRCRNLEGVDRNVKNIFIKTPSREVSLVFCLDEMEVFVLFLNLVLDKLTVKKLAREALEMVEGASSN